MLADTAYVEIAVGILLGWIGLFVLHTIVLAMAASREDDIVGEIDKLRAAADDYEKPKRLALGDDGELVEMPQDNFKQQQSE